MVLSYFQNIFWILSIVTSSIGTLYSKAIKNTLPSMADQKKIPLCTLKTTTTFCEFPQNYKPTRHLKNKKWALIASVMLKSKIALHLESLTLQWRGKPLHHINASLYSKRETDDKVIPIEDNLVCDGEWNDLTQRVIFYPDKKITAIDELYLVLSYPKKQEPDIKMGKFVFPSQKSASLSPIR